jgi:hypothetical protein
LYGAGNGLFAVAAGHACHGEILVHRKILLAITPSKRRW